MARGEASRSGEHRTHTLIHDRADLLGTIRFRPAPRRTAFDNVDQRLLNLELVQSGLTHAVIFDSSGRNVEPGELLYKKPILVQRGTFRPITLVHEHMLHSARAQFGRTTNVATEEATALMEITTANLRATSDFEPNDFLARLDILRELARPVLISNYAAFHRLESYLNRYSQRDIGFVVGVLVLREVFDEKYYVDLDGGALEAFGRLFKRKVKLYVYPSRDPNTGDVLTATSLSPAPSQALLYRYLLDNGFIVPISEYREELFSIHSPATLEALRNGDAAWEEQVPEPVARLIKERGLFQYRAECQPV